MSKWLAEILNLPESAEKSEALEKRMDWLELNQKSFEKVLNEKVMENIVQIERLQADLKKYFMNLEYMSFRLNNFLELDNAIKIHNQNEKPKRKRGRPRKHKPQIIHEIKAKDGMD